MKVRLIKFWLLLLALTVAGCSGGNTDTHTLGSDPYVNADGTPVVFARFDPGAEVMPLPNDVVWAGNDTAVCPVGQVCLPPAAGDSAEMAGLKTLVNSLALPGLSPNMFLTVPVTGAIDSSTLQLIVFRTDDPQLPNLLGALAAQDLTAAAAAFGAMEIRTQADFVAEVDTASGELKLLPKTPFTPGAAYAVVVKSSLQDTGGHPVKSSLTMEALKQTTAFSADSPFVALEALRAKYNDDVSPTEPALFTVTQGVTAVANGGVPWTRDDTLVLWTFQTAAATLTVDASATFDYPDGATDPFATTAATFKGGSALFTANNLVWLDYNPATGTSAPAAGPVGVAAATLLTPQGIPSGNLSDIYFGVFQSPTLASGLTTGDNVPFLLAEPDATVVGPGPYPVVIFQHGITSDKTAALAIANTLASVGYVTLAIDAPYHGDRTVSGGQSGDGFFTANLLQDRANIYQAAVDLWETVDVLGTINTDLTGAAIGGIDTANVEFIAHSLGSIIGSVFLSQETRVDKMVLSSPSSLLVNVLDDTSLSDLQALVASLGYTKGTSSYYVFLNLAQWLLDPVDGTYNGIGSNPTGNLLAVYAYGDPIVSPDSTKVFAANLGIDLATIGVVDPADSVVFGVSPSPLAGVYQYGLEGHPIVHSFLLSPLFDATTEPYYTGYSPTDQESATTASQTQVAGFLLPPPL